MEKSWRASGDGRKTNNNIIYTRAAEESVAAAVAVQLTPPPLPLNRYGDGGVSPEML